VRLRAIPMHDAEGVIIGVAECFDEIVDVGEWNKRHSKLAEYGCLDAASGLLTHKMVEARLRVVMVSFMKGTPPVIAVEFARRAIPGHVRPSFQETEKHIKNKDGAAAAPAAAAA
jgi:hypothetical protein